MQAAASANPEAQAGWLESLVPRACWLHVRPGGPPWLLVGTVCCLLGTVCTVAACVHMVATAPRTCTDPNVHVLEPAWPEMYGKVPEKTIWSYWYDPVGCPSSTHCTLPPLVQLCTESVWTNKGGFSYKIMHMDEIDKYISRLELPLQFDRLKPALQKDSLMNALLSRYGGVAMDITSILLRPLDEYWDDMLSRNATFWGYMYRLTGMHWGNSEATAVWFLMSRRQGIFATAVRSQMIGMGDDIEPPQKTGGNGYFYHNPYFAFGDQTLTPILRTFNYKLPKCTDDPTVGPPVSWPDMCPEYESPAWNTSMPGPARNDARIILREPRDGPQLPYAFLDDFSMGTWRVNSEAGVAHSSDACKTMKECWHDIFMYRYQQRSGPKGTHLLNFVKLFHSGGRLLKMDRAQLLGDEESYFYNWLKLAGMHV